MPKSPEYVPPSTRQQDTQMAAAGEANMHMQAGASAQQQISGNDGAGARPPNPYTRKQRMVGGFPTSLAVELGKKVINLTMVMSKFDLEKTYLLSEEEKKAITNSDQRAQSVQESFIAEEVVRGIEKSVRENDAKFKAQSKDMFSTLQEPARGLILQQLDLMHKEMAAQHIAIVLNNMTKTTQSVYEKVFHETPNTWRALPAVMAAMYLLSTQKEGLINKVFQEGVRSGVFFGVGLSSADKRVEDFQMISAANAVLKAYTVPGADKSLLQKSAQQIARDMANNTRTGQSLGIQLANLLEAEFEKKLNASQAQAAGASSGSGDVQCMQKIILLARALTFSSSANTYLSSLMRELLEAMDMSGQRFWTNALIMWVSNISAQMHNESVPETQRSKPVVEFAICCRCGQLLPLRFLAILARHSSWNGPQMVCWAEEITGEDGIKALSLSTCITSVMRRVTYWNIKCDEASAEVDPESFLHLDTRLACLLYLPPEMWQCKKEDHETPDQAKNRVAGMRAAAFDNFIRVLQYLSQEMLTIERERQEQRLGATNWHWQVASDSMLPWTNEQRLFDNIITIIVEEEKNQMSNFEDCVLKCVFANSQNLSIDDANAVLSIRQLGAMVQEQIEYNASWALRIIEQDLDDIFNGRDDFVADSDASDGIDSSGKDDMVSESDADARVRLEEENRILREQLEASQARIAELVSQVPLEPGNGLQVNFAEHL